MIQSIIKKEWLKLKFYFLALFVITLATLGYFAFNLDFAFSTIEPESMMWYKFAHLQDKPYFYLSYLYLGFGAAVALGQFIPERIQRRIKIMAHLPLNLRDALFMHLLIGISFIFILSTILSLGILFILMNYYTPEIIKIAFKDTFFYTFAGSVLYLGLSSVIIERNNLIAFFKFVLVALFTVVFLKIEYNFQSDLLWGLFFIFLPFMALDSFYSIKQQRLESIVFKASLGVAVIFILVSSYFNYTQNYKHNFNKYYIFYSNVINDFVYQKNFGDHHFEYGIKDKKTFNREEYESYLPFVYWRNLDIQKKLPVVIGDKSFDKKTIKYSRLGFSYNPEMLKPLEVELYPLLNPQKDKGMIKFPEEVFSIDKKGINIYDFDHRLLDEQVDDISMKLLLKDFKYPALNIWGKATNMKPFDKGYLIQDAKKELYNLKKEDGTAIVNKIPYPKGLEIDFIKLSENKQKLLSGYVIDKKSNFYFLTWDFEFIKLHLDNFDHKTMKLKVISNPLNYLIRYDDGKNYYAGVFSKKDFTKIKTVLMD